MVYVGYFNSIIGTIRIEADEDYLLGIRVVPYAMRDEEINGVVSKCMSELDEYFYGKRSSFDVPLFFKGTEFQIKVWKELMNIPYGTTVSYKDIANKVGKPSAVRAVGTAIGKNPFFIFIPCHRVIGADGTLGGFAYCLDIKAKLLEIEKEHIRLKSGCQTQDGLI